MGDFNTCLLKDDVRSKRLLSTADSFNLHVLPLNPTHFFPNCSPSLLDLILVSNTDLVVKHGQLPAEAFSYHDLLFLSYKLRSPKIKPQILMQRSFGDMDLNRLADDAEKLDWGQVYGASDVNDMVTVFNSLLTQLYDIHAPIKPVRIKQLPAPWLTKEIKAAINSKNRAKSK
ncbi:uncharacterized protein LOC123699906 [Colias croceus]|uniref:uncharacterized protein LOC123699906 n=1 Tax=Colias crocea TaxID=72248 RepID=UPI001E27BBFD|nr:uncharacterized protein LOC123699906 [Colias croceus]